MPPFVRWGPSHLSAVFLTLLVPLALAAWARGDASHRRANVIGAAFGVVLVLKEVAQVTWIEVSLYLPWQDMLPLDLCDLALFACVVAGIARWQLAYELAYFWGLAGTIQGLLTPELAYGFPTLYFWFFFLGHGGIVATVIFLSAAGIGLRPHWSSVRRAYLGTLVYAMVVGPLDAALHTNYGFLCAKPPTSSLLDVLGPWPWYLASLALVGLVFMVVLYLPWKIADHLSHDDGSHQA